MHSSVFATESYSLEIYFREVKNAKSMTQEEEIALFKLYKENRAILKSKTRDGEELKRANRKIQYIKEKLIKSQSKMIFAIARKYTGRGLAYADLIQEGNAGILKAIDKFDFSMGNRFSTYAQYWVRAAICQAIEHGHSVSLPAYMEELLNQMRKEKNILTQRLSRVPTEAELGDALGQKSNRLAAAWKNGRIAAAQKAVQAISLDAFESDDTVFYNAASEFLSCQDPALEVLARLYADEIRTKLLMLTPKEQKVIALRFGLYNCKPSTLQEISNRLAVSRQAVCQTESRAIGKLRKVLCA